MRSKGRRPGNPDTKAEILSAARIEFGDNGYDGATIRSVAARAGVDPALVMHYFQSKDRLFSASIELPVNPATVMRGVLEHADGSQGTELVRTLLTIWDSGNNQFVALLRSATTTGAMSDTVREFIHRSILDTLTEVVGGSNAAMRASLMSSQLVGLLVGRYILEFPELVEASVEELAIAVGPVIDQYATM